MVTTSSMEHSEEKQIGFPKALFICRGNSQPFSDRTLIFKDTSLKVGRSLSSNAQSKSNLIFDCRVLSRNHAILWFKEGQFYIRDTNSSNGTFVNNERLHSSLEGDSKFSVLYSGDVLQFGVEVLEDSQKVINGCIIGTIKLFSPEGHEIHSPSSLYSHLPPGKDSSFSSISSTPNNCSSQSITVSSSSSSSFSSSSHKDTLSLIHYIKEAHVRESILEKQLGVLEKVILDISEASSKSWNSLLSEDQLLSRIESLEEQLAIYSKNSSQKELRDKVRSLLSDKDLYEEKAKSLLLRYSEDKKVLLNQVSDIQSLLSSSEKEILELQEKVNKEISENLELSEQILLLKTELSKSTLLFDKTFSLKDSCIGNMKGQLSEMENQFSCLSKDHSALEDSLVKAERKISKLIYVREKYIEVFEEKNLLEADKMSLLSENERLKGNQNVFLTLISLLFLLLAISLYTYLF